MIKDVSFTEIDVEKTTTSQTGILLPTTADIQSIDKYFKQIFRPSLVKEASDSSTENTKINVIMPSAYIFETFKTLISNMETEANRKLSESKSKSK